MNKYEARSAYQAIRTLTQTATTRTLGVALDSATLGALVGSLEEAQYKS